MRLVCIVLFVFSILILFLSASRSALFSFLVCLVIILYTSARRNGILNILIFSIVLGSVLFSFRSNIKPYLQVLLYKVELRNNSDDFTAGRGAMSRDNLEDFISSPLIGVGFYNVINSNNTKVNEDGSLEYPSGWLFILSSTGVIGFLYFLIISKNYFKYIVRIAYLSDSRLLLVLYITFFFVHMFFEGYVYSAGGLLFFLFWTLLTRLKLNPENFTKGQWLF